jgi:hypothetical protein
VALLKLLGGKGIRTHARQSWSIDFHDCPPMCLNKGLAMGLEERGNQRNLLDLTSIPRYLLPAEFPTFLVASITKKPSSKYWFVCFRDLQGKQRRVST